MKKCILIMMVMLVASLSYGQDWTKIIVGPNKPSKTELGYIKGLTAKPIIQAESDNRYPKKEDNSGVYDYVIEKIASTYYARPRASSSLIAYSGAVASTVINSAITAITSGGKIYIKPGIYDITTPILIENATNLKIEGSGWDKTIFTSVGGGGTIYQVIELRGICSKIEISEIGITSTVTNATEQTNSALIYGGAYAAGLVDVQITGLDIHNCRFTAPNVNMNAMFVTVSTANSYMYDFKFTDNYIHDVGRAGVEVIDHDGTLTVVRMKRYTISGNQITATGISGTWGMGISLSGKGDAMYVANNNIYDIRKNQGIENYLCDNSVITGNKIKGATYHMTGITGYSSNNLVISNNTVDLSDPDAPAIKNTSVMSISLDGCTNSTIASNYLKGSYVFLYNCNYINLTGNIIKQQGSFGMLLQGTTTNTKATGNTFDDTHSTWDGASLVRCDGASALYNEFTNNIAIKNSSTVYLDNATSATNNTWETTAPVSMSTTSDGVYAKLCPGSQFVNVASGSANNLLMLPEACAALIGAKVRGKVGATGFELRVAATQATTVYLNNVTTNVEAAIPANTLFEVELVDATHWVLKAWTMLGAPITPIVPDAN